MGAYLVVIAEPGPTLLAYDLAGALVCQQWLGDPVAERFVFEVAPLGDDAFVLAGQIRVPGESPNLWIARFAGPNP